MGVGCFLDNYVKNEIFEITKNYVIEKSFEIGYNQLLIKGESKIRECCNEYIGKPILNKFIKNSSNSTKPFVMDLVNEDNLFKNYCINQINQLFELLRKISEQLKQIKKTFEKIRKENSKVVIILEIISTTISLFKELYPSLKSTKEKINLNEKDFLSLTKDEKFLRFDGSLTSLIQIKFQTYEENSSRKIKTICENLIKYNVIDNKGKFDSKQIENEELNQIFFLEIDEEFQSIN